MQTASTKTAAWSGPGIIYALTSEEGSEQMKIVEKQVIVNWYEPREKLPPEGMIVAATISGKTGNITFDHALVMAEWYDDGDGWTVGDFDFTKKGSSLTVHAWADLEPYKGGEQ